MAPIIEQVLRLLSVPQGNLIYAIVLAICSFAAWLASIYARGKRESTTSDRMQRGLLFLFVAQLVLLVISWLAWLGIINPHSYLPPIDRTFALFSLVLIIWLWAIPDPDKILDAITILVEFFILLFGGTGIVLWLRVGSNAVFNTSMVGAYAFFSGLGLLIIAVILVLLRRPGLWGYGIFVLLILLAGYLAQVIIGQPASDYAWFIHLSEMVGFVFLLLLPKRLVAIDQIAEIKPQEIPAKLPTAGMDGKLIQSISSLLTEPSPQKYYEDLTRLVAQVMNAQYCLLIMPPKTGDQLILPVGYNGQQDLIIDGFTADGRNMPSILDAVRKGSTLRMNGSVGLEVRALADQLGMKQVTHLLIIPFHPTGTSAVMGIAVLTKPNMPVWSEADAVRLKDVTETMLSNTVKSRSLGWQAEQGELMGKLQRAEALTDQVRLEYAQLKAKYDSVSSQVAVTSVAQAENEKALQENIIRLESRNRDLESLLARGRPSMEELEQLRLELRAALADLARIPSTLSRSDQKMLETQLSAVKSLDKMQPTELVTSIAQEFRQPLSSIVGYTDLLLGESVGLLGAVQRKFLERVRASTERLGFLLNELVEVMTIDGGRVDQTSVSVDLEPTIHEAIGNINAQLNEKNITIQLDLPESLPAIRANKDALLQILNNLLENACLVTAPDGEIRLTARVEQREGKHDFILISVADQGGGIESTDISRVFLRRYKMENPLIKGVGDMGVGLSIVKSLVELLKGRVWVDSQPGGSVFSVLLPLTEDQSSNQAK